MLICNRRFDTLNRVAIPKEFAEKLKIEKDVPVEITLEYGDICIRKFDERDFEKRSYVGIVRDADNLNRVAIPAEYVAMLKLQPSSIMKISLEGDVVKIRS